MQKVGGGEHKEQIQNTLQTIASKYDMENNVGKDFGRSTSSGCQIASPLFQTPGHEIGFGIFSARLIQKKKKVIMFPLLKKNIIPKRLSLLSASPNQTKPSLPYSYIILVWNLKKHEATIDASGGPFWMQTFREYISKTPNFIWYKVVILSHMKTLQLSKKAKKKEKKKSHPLRRRKETLAHRIRGRRVRKEREKGTKKKKLPLPFKKNIFLVKPNHFPHSRM